jgi:hypothetical protein
MANVKLHPLLQEVHGRFGDTVFKRGANGQTIMTRVPRMPGKTRRVRRNLKTRMEDAHACARAAMADPEQKKRYERKAKKNGSKAYWMALSDYLSTQKISSIHNSQAARQVSLPGGSF